MLSTGSKIESKELDLLVGEIGDISCGGLQIMME